MAAIGHVVMLATQDMDKRTLAQACRVLGVLVAGLYYICTCVATSLSFCPCMRVYIEEGQGRVLGALVAVLKESTRACVHVGAPLQ